ncbi:MAG: 50S ribosomal protein L15 [Chloroflexota bacterium]
MTRQDELHPAPGAVKNRKRVGRGDASGHGSYSGRGQKGQKARSGGKVRPGFEGGQLPLIKRLPRKRGFTNIFRIEYQVVNVKQLGVFEAKSEVTPGTLLGRGLVKSSHKPVKILASGELKQPLTVTAHKFSAAAKSKIEAAGGKVAEVALASQTD